MRIANALGMVAVVAGIICFAGCSKNGDSGSEDTEQVAQIGRMVTLTDLSGPECVECVKDRQKAFISNIAPGEEGPWSLNEKGYISLINYDGSVEEKRWLQSSPGLPLNGPKGLTVLDGYLYIADIDRFLRVPIKGDRVIETLPVEGLKQANDVATDGTEVWVSDTATGRIYAYNPADGTVRDIQGPEGLNGITFDGAKMYGASWALHEIFVIDPDGIKEPRALGLADKFKSLDGIEVMEDGSLIVSDFLAGTVYKVSADLKSVKMLINLKTPADIDVDEEVGRLFVPQSRANKAVILNLKNLGG